MTHHHQGYFLDSHFVKNPQDDHKIVEVAYLTAFHHRKEILRLLAKFYGTTINAPQFIVSKI